MSRAKRCWKELQNKSCIKIWKYFADLGLISWTNFWSVIWIFLWLAPSNHRLCFILEVVTQLIKCLWRLSQKCSTLFSYKTFWKSHTDIFYVYFRSFQTTFYTKNYLQRDSNFDHQSRRGARWPLDHHYHGPGAHKKYFERNSQR